MFVWPYDPEIYFRADRPPAIRYIATEKAYQLGQAGQPLMDETIALLKETRPKVLLIPPDQVTRFEEPHPKGPLTYGDMGTWLRANYRLCEDAGRQDIWLRIELR